MINTVFRLIILVPAALLLAFAAASSLESGGIGVIAFLVSATIAAIAVALIVWTLVDHRKRARAKDELNA